MVFVWFGEDANITVPPIERDDAYFNYFQKVMKLFNLDISGANSGNCVFQASRTTVGASIVPRDRFFAISAVGHN